MQKEEWRCKNYFHWKPSGLPSCTPDDERVCRHCKEPSDAAIQFPQSSQILIN